MMMNVAGLQRKKAWSENREIRRTSIQYDESKVTTRKRKRPEADAQTKLSKKPRKSDIAGLFSGHNNTLSQLDGEAGGTV